MFIPISDASGYGPAMLGGKGAGLVEMRDLGLPVPQAYILPTPIYQSWYDLAFMTMDKITSALPEMRAGLQAKYGYMPLVSIRSGAPVSMPGMMDTVLNAGIDAESYDFWVSRMGKDKLHECARRFIMQYEKVVHENTIDVPAGENPLTWYAAHVREWPDVNLQLRDCIEAVMLSWNSPRAKVYRHLHNIDSKMGTAVIVQAMVFGNLNDNSYTGVMFSRDPDSGDNNVVGEYLVNAQGEDVVNGSVTPLPLKQLREHDETNYNFLMQIALDMEQVRGYPQDIEFTVEDGILWVLQTRNMKRSARAAIRIALSYAKAGETNLSKLLTMRDYSMAQVPTLDPAFKDAPAYTGLPACSGIATGTVVTSSEKAAIQGSTTPVILVTRETNPEDIAGMHASVGILTMAGGATSHAAVIARGMNKPAVVGLGDYLKDFKDGDTISICGATGRVWRGSVPVLEGTTSADLMALEAIALKDHCRLGTQVLDITDDYLMDPKVTAARIIEALEARPSVMIKHRPDAAQLALYALFGVQVKDHIVAALNAVPEALQPHVALLGWPEGLSTLKGVWGVFDRVNTPDDLVAVTSDYVLGDSVDSVMGLSKEVLTKIINWQLKDGNKPILVGKTMDGVAAHLTPAQAVNAMLGG